MVKPLFTAALILVGLSACSAVDSSVHSSSTTQATVAPYTKAFLLANGYSLVVTEGAMEPRSIGSVQVSLYRNLDVGDFVAHLAFRRDGFIQQAQLVSDKPQKQKLVVTMMTAGTGHYQNSQSICVEGDSISLC